MAGTKERYKIQWISKGNVPGDGKIRTVTAQGTQSAKNKFLTIYEPPRGAWLAIWPMGNPDAKKLVRVR